MSDPAAIVRRYSAIVADLGSTPDALRDVLHPDVLVTEHPNAMNPRGAVRDRDALIAGFQAGNRLLASQTIEILELLVSGDRVSVRATWRGTIAEGSGALPPGPELVAHIAAWVTVADGRISEHETFDCYGPLPAAEASP